MNNARFHKSVAPKGKYPFILHLDLKHDNGEFHRLRARYWALADTAIVLLGEPPSHDEGLNYPSVKVADWGLAEYTSVESYENSSKWRGYGTPCWMPPVSFLFFID